MDKHNKKPKINYRKLLEENHINGESKQTNEQQELHNTEHQECEQIILTILG
jgi:hypothetical protein